MKKNDVINVTITDCKFPNIGIGHYQDYDVLVKNAIVGQNLSVKINKKYETKCEGKIVGVLDKSYYETNIPCPHYINCGGCYYQTISYDDESKIKEKMILKIFKDFDIINYMGFIKSKNIKNYRNKMEFSFGDEEINGKLALGMRKKDSFYEVETVNMCSIIHSDFRKILMSTLGFFRNKNISFYHRRKHDGVLRHLVVRKSNFNGDILVNLVTSNNFDFETIKEYAQQLIELETEGVIKGIIHTINDSVADVVKHDCRKILYGDDFIYENVFGLKFKITPESFFQTNSESIEELYSSAISMAGDLKEKTVLDLFCGTGTISQVISKSCKEVIGIEIVPEAVNAANESASKNGINNCTFIVGDVLNEIDNINKKPDIIFLDPPRSGINKKAIKKIIKYNSPEIIYISCNPITLAKDLECFLEDGYVIDKLQIIDMFPRTCHVESVVLMSRVES